MGNEPRGTGTTIVRTKPGVGTGETLYQTEDGRWWTDAPQAPGNSAGTSVTGVERRVLKNGRLL